MFCYTFNAHRGTAGALFVVSRCGHERPPSITESECMERKTRQGRVSKLKAWSAVGALAGLAIFSGLAAASTRQSQRRVTTPVQQLNILENRTGYTFFSSAKVTPPAYVSSPAQVSSGGS